MQISRLAALSAWLPLVACREPASTGMAHEPSSAATPILTADASPGSTSSSTTSTSNDAGAATQPTVDLLHEVPCVVAVSSKVDNPKDFPEHLVDGKNETAWNSKTGDLHGFIRFRVPKVSRVTRVELTVGFVKTGASGDLFTKNHRIEKVRLSREGRIVKDVSLDPESRALQGFDVDEEGGDFELQVLATRPGTEKTWRELTVSEFRVMGLANGAPDNPQHVPLMAIGSLDGVPARAMQKGEPPPGPFAGVKELCAAWDKAMAGPIKAAFPGDRYPGEIGGPHCSRMTDARLAKVRAAVSKGPFLSGEFLHVNEPELEKARLMLQTDKGVSLTNVVLWSRYHGDPGCGHASEEQFEDATLTTTSMGRPTLIVRILRSDVYWLGARDPGGTVENAYACSVDANGAASCEGPVVVGRSVGWPAGWDLTTGSFPTVDPEKTKWAFRHEPVLGPAGDLR